MASRELDIIIRVKDEASKNTDKVKDSLAGLGDAADKAGQKSSGMLGRIAEFAVGGVVTAGLLQVASGIANIGQSMIGGNAAFEAYEGRFTTMLGSADLAKQKIQELSTFANTTPFELPGVIQAAQNLRTLGGAAADTPETLTLVGNAAAATGADLERVSFWIGRAFSAMQSGQSWGDAASELQSMGVLSGEARTKLEALQKEGKKGPEVWNAFTTSINAPKDALEKMAGTWGGLTSTLSDTIAGAVRTMGKPVFDAAKSALIPAVNILNSPEVQGKIAEFGTKLGEGIEKGIPILVDGFKKIAPVVIEVVKNIGDIAQAALTFGKALAPVAGFLVDNFVPAMQTATIVGGAYAVMTVGQMIPAIIASVPALVAQAAALAATLGPIVLITAAVFGMAKAWNDYNSAHDAALDKLLDSRQWWTDSEKAMEGYNKASAAVKTGAKEQATELENLMGAQKMLINTLARDMELGRLIPGEYEQRMAAINAYIPAINEERDALEARMQLIQEGQAEAASFDAVNAQMAGGFQQTAQAAKLSEAEIAKLNETIKQAGQAIGQGFAAIVSSNASFRAALKNADDQYAKQVSGIHVQLNQTLQNLAAARQKIETDGAKRFGEINTQLGERLTSINKDLGKKLADIGKQTGERLADIEKQLGAKLADIKKATGEQLSAVDTQLGERLADINKQVGARIADINKATGERTADIRKATGEKLRDIDKQLGTTLGDIAVQTGKRITEINEATAKRLSDLDKKVTDERKRAYTDLQQTLSSTLAKLNADQEANDLDLAGATGDRLKELQRREQAEAAMRTRMQTAAREAQAFAKNGEAALGKEVFGIRQQSAQKMTSLEDAYQKRKVELAGNPEALRELDKQYHEAVLAEENAVNQQIEIAKAAEAEKKALAAAERQAVLDAAREQKEAVLEASREQVKAAKEAAAEQKQAARDAAAEQIKATEDAAEKQRQTAQEQAAEQRTQATEQAAERRQEIRDQAEEQRQAAQQQAAEQRQQAQDQAAQQRQAAAEQAAEQRTQAVTQAEQQRQQAAEQLAAQRQGNAEQVAAAKAAAGEQLAAAAQAHRDQLAGQVAAHAEQRAEQRAHLGESLIEDAIAWGKKNQLTDTEIKRMTDTLKTEYGIQGATAAETSAVAQRAFEEWATNGGKDADRVIDKLRNIESQSTETQIEMNDLAGDYHVQLTDNLIAGKLRAQDLDRALDSIDRKVITEIELKAKFVDFDAPTEKRRAGGAVDETGGNLTKRYGGQRAGGGSVSPDSWYMVGEKGPEIFAPALAGSILDADRTQHLLDRIREQRSGQRGPVMADRVASGGTGGTFDSPSLVNRGGGGRNQAGWLGTSGGGSSGVIINQTITFQNTVVDHTDRIQELRQTVQRDIKAANEELTAALVQSFYQAQQTGTSV